MHIVLIKFIPFVDIMAQKAPLEFPIPNEIIEIVIAYLSTKDLLVLASIGTERLKKCAFRFLREKLCGKY